MEKSPIEDSLRERHLNAIILKYYRSRELGEHCDQEKLIADHPEFSGELREFFADENLLIADESRSSAKVNFARTESDKPDSSENSSLRWAVPGEFPERHFGPYEILEELGLGGMGIVYKARHLKLNKLVALKMIRTGAFASDFDVRLFEAEVRALGRLEHPGIIAVHEVGKHLGQHFYSMDYVSGGNLSTLYRNGPVPAKKAALLVRQLAEALQYAHDQGIVHRDLKPANILLTTAGTPRIADFGLAKRMWVSEDSIAAHITRSGQILGTPGYMSPEQAAGKSQLVGPLSDVYATGAVLYTLLTGRPPFSGGSQALTIAQVIHNEPVSPRALNADIPRDLETICLKCLNKEPHLRYGTPQLLADDLQRYLENRPVLARPIGYPTRWWRWCRRNPVVASLSTGVLCSMLIGSGVSTYFAHHAITRANDNQRLAAQERSARNAADTLRRAWEKEAMNSRRHLYCAHMNLAKNEWSAGRIGLVMDLLERHRPTDQSEDLRSFEWHHWLNRCRSELQNLEGHTSHVASVAFDSQGNRVVSASHDGTVKLWDASTGSLQKSLIGHTDAVKCAVFSPDGTRIASASWDKTVRLWDAVSGKPIHIMRSHSAQVESVAFSPDGETLASTGRDGIIWLWKTDSGTELLSLGKKGAFATSVAFSPNGRMLASTQSDVACIWDLTTREIVTSLRGHRGQVLRVAFSPDSSFGSTAGYDGTIKLWDAKTGKLVRTSIGHRSAVNWVCHSPNGKLLASAGSDYTIRLWDAASGEEKLQINAHRNYVAGIAFSPDSHRVVSAGWDNSIKIWDTTKRQDSTTLRGHSYAVRSIRFTPNRTTLVSGCDTGTIHQWSPEGGPPKCSFKAHVGGIYSLDVSPDGAWIASCGADDAIKIWPINETNPAKTLNLDKGSVRRVRFSPAGNVLFFSGTDRKLKMWNLNDSSQLELFAEDVGIVRDFVFTQTGDRLAAACSDGTILLWDVASRKILQRLEGHTLAVQSVSFSPDGQTLVSGGLDGTVRLWNLTTHREVLQIKGHSDGVYAVAVSPDGKRIASASGDGTFKLWDLISGEETLSANGTSRHLYDLQFSRDGMLVAASNYNGDIQVWSAFDLSQESSSPTEGSLQLSEMK